MEAVFRTKAALLGAAVDYAIRGDAEPTPILQREEVRRMEEAETAQELLDLHAAHLRRIVPRSARIVSVVEHSAAADPAVAELWRTLDQNRRTGVGWAADTLLRKRDRPSGLERPEVEAIFWVAVNWGTYRTLAELAGLDLDGYEAWLVRFYAATLLGPR
ncbi:MAG: hypothetical protein M5U27_02065 [Gaiella sp.]|nr:hypothetical protein [Gaiella sp.]